jgi:hypothetical protein
MKLTENELGKLIEFACEMLDHCDNPIDLDYVYDWMPDFLSDSPAVRHKYHGELEFWNGNAR